MNKTLNDKKIGKVLIVDDCAQMRQAIRSTVEDLAEDFVEADGGAAAVRAYLQHKPDWVTLDLAMRPVDGLSALWEIKSRDPQARVLVLTSHDTNAFRQAATLAGASDYILKDDLEKIREVIVPASATPASCSPRAAEPSPAGRPDTSLSL